MSTVPRAIAMTASAAGPAGPAGPAAGEPESLAELIGDGRRMAEQWQAPPAGPAPAAVTPGSLRGITVPAASAQVVEGMAEFGD
jgi:hypothetical protein